MAQILVEKDGATYAFGSVRGSHYWYVNRPANNRSFPYRVGHIIPTAYFGEMYELAYQSGYTEEDFSQLRTYIPTPGSRSTKLKVSTSKSGRKTTLSSGKSSKPVKSKLTDSVKLFL